MDRAPVPSEGRPTAAQVAAWVALLIAVFSLYLRGVGSFQVGVYQDDAIYMVLAHSIAFGDEYGLDNAPGRPRPSKYPFMFPLLLSPFARLHPVSGEADESQEGRTAGANLASATVIPLAATLMNLSLLFWGWPLLSRSSRWWAVGVAWMHGLSPLVVGHSRVVMSEPVFVTFVLAVLLLTEMCARNRSRSLPFLALGGAIAAAVFTRSIGVAVAAAAVLRLGLHLLIDREIPAPLRREPLHVAPALVAGQTPVGVRAQGPLRTRQSVLLDGIRQLALVALGTVTLVGVVLAATSVDLRHLPPTAYVDEMLAGSGTPKSGKSETLAAQILRVADGYFIEDVRDVILPIAGGGRARTLARHLGLRSAPEWIGAAVAGVVLLGVWQAVRAALLSPVVLLFEILYFAAVLLWPWHAPRYLYPVQPFLQLQFLLGVAWIGSLVMGTDLVLASPNAAVLPAPKGRKRNLSPFSAAGCRLSAAACLALLLGSAWKSFEVEDSRAFTRDLTIGADWLAAHTRPEAVVMSRYPQAVYLYSGRRTVDLAALRARADFEKAIGDGAVDYVLFAPILTWGATGSPAYGDEEKLILPALAEMVSRGQAELVYESEAREKILIYRLRRPSRL